ncbi:hypothetical protein H2198_001407 [Neophaeococcomyces mojaviensis]|uniref:Uncharacterized protein n=1 Tax=Neophaeococcomyces mojaviensis TaxID=3383035 RepID=A0ACC3AH35_9EURO|nr:hypothetical protein H2198_001407 [Knufia sp. JES_112]
MSFQQDEDLQSTSSRSSSYVTADETYTNLPHKTKRKALETSRGAGNTRHSLTLPGSGDDMSLVEGFDSILARPTTLPRLSSNDHPLPPLPLGDTSGYAIGSFQPFLPQLLEAGEQSSENRVEHVVDAALNSDAHMNSHSAPEPHVPHVPHDILVNKTGASGKKWTQIFEFLKPKALVAPILVKTRKQKKVYRKRRANSLKSSTPALSYTRTRTIKGHNIGNTTMYDNSTAQFGDRYETRNLYANNVLIHATKDQHPTSTLAALAYNLGVGFAGGVGYGAFTSWYSASDRPDETADPYRAPQDTHTSLFTHQEPREGTKLPTPTLDSYPPVALHQAPLPVEMVPMLADYQMYTDNHFPQSMRIEMESGYRAQEPGQQYYHSYASANTTRDNALVHYAQTDEEKRFIEKTRSLLEPSNF